MLARCYTDSSGKYQKLSYILLVETTTRSTAVPVNLTALSPTDTLPSLKGAEFGTICAATLARVKGSTPSKRSEIHDGPCLNPTIRSIPCSRADIACPVCISMDHSTTAGTGIDPSSWCILPLTLTITACACRIVLWNVASFHSILG